MSEFKDILHFLFEHKSLSRVQAQQTLKAIAAGGIPESQVAAFLTVFIMRGIRVEELEGFRDAMLDLCLPIDLSEYDPMDLCGTGGDGKDTFNISTLSSFVVAGSGIKVAKHGNYGVSSVSGSSNVIEYFGYTFTNDTNKLKKSIEDCNICFLHAPLFHPAMKHVAPVRRAMKVKTFFNMLGPMVNPSNVKKQLVGVFNLELARLYGYLYQQTDKRYTIVHALDGYDEVSLTGPVKLIRNNGEFIVTPEELNQKTLKADALKGGNSVKEAAQLFERILKGEGTKAQNAVVLTNASLAIQVANPEMDFLTAKENAEASLLGGKALNVFKKFINQ